MAPREQSQQKKRGRPPRASIAPARDPEIASREEPARPIDASKKRGRPRKSIDTIVPEETRPATAGPSNPATKRRGGPPKVSEPEPEESDPVGTRPRKRKRDGLGEETEDVQERAGRSKAPKRGRPAAGAPQEASVLDENAGRTVGGGPAQPLPDASGATKGRRGRPPRKSVGRDDAAEDKNTGENSTRRSPRTQESTGNEPPQDAAGSGGQPQVAAKRKRGRPSLAELPISRAQNQNGQPHGEMEEQGAKKRRGRPRRTSDEAGSPNQPAEALGSSNPRRQPTKSPQRRTSSDTNPPLQQQQNRESEDEPQPPPPSRTHQLTTLTRHIPRTTIASKWAPLPTPSINAITSLLQDSARPVLHRLRERDQRHAQAASILRTFSARLHAKLVKGMPFPPPAMPALKARGRKPKDGGEGGGGGGHETELNFERTVDAIAGLERALDPLLHSVVLLKGEKEREQKALERDYENLRRLEGNARAQARGWKEGKGKGREHVLVGGIGASEGRDEEKDDGLKVVARATGAEGGGVFQDLQDEALVALSQQIGNHMESMKSNLSQIEGVLPAIARSRAALQGTLCEHLDPEQYEQVLLG